MYDILGLNMTTLLNIEEITKFTSKYGDWEFEEDCLKAKFVLANFDTAMEVVEMVAKVAREMDHHPLWTNVYNQLSFSLCTHSAGDKVTELDLKLAQKISESIQEVGRE